MSLLLSALTIGFILSFLAFGVYLSFRIFDFPDITAEGSITLGAACAAVMLTQYPGMPPAVAACAGFALGATAGVCTGVLHTVFGIHKLLSGILVMTALYTVNLRLMGRSNVPLLNSRTLSTEAEELGLWASGGEKQFTLTLGDWGWETSAQDVAMLGLVAAVVLVAGVMLYWFLRTNLGTAMRATGDNDQMIRALGVNTKGMIVLGLGLSNGLIALSGALMAQYQGFADIGMGIGMVVWGLASVIIGEALVRSRSLGLTICGAVMGSILFRLLVALALRGGMDPNDLKLITAVFVFAALVLPGALGRCRNALARRGAESGAGAC